MKLFVFSSGPHQTQWSQLQQGAEGPVTIPIGFFLVQHPQGNVLFDTGTVVVRRAVSHTPGSSSSRSPSPRPGW